MVETRELIRKIEEDASLPTGSNAQFSAYAVIALPLHSRHVLCKKRKQEVRYKVKVEADQAPNLPQVFTWVRIHHAITGEDVSAQAIEDAAGAIVKLGAELHTTCEIVLAAEAALDGE